jgi:hypothetical protein
MREQARTLLQPLVGLLVPVLEPLSFQEQTLEGHNQRANMLAMYEWEHKRLKQIGTEHKAKEERLTALQQAYPKKSATELSTWIDDLAPASIAEKLVAEQSESAGSATYIS